jgi:hypothetical protein
VKDLPLSGIESDLVNALLHDLGRPDAVVEQVVAGERFIAVVAGGRVGLSSLLGARPSEGEKGLAENAVGRTVDQVAQCLLRPSPFAICLGMAALNAANAPDPDAVTGGDASAEALITELGRGRTVGLVGEFPFVDALREKVGTLHLFELRDVPGAIPPDRWEEVLSGLDVLAVTGTALLTRQMGYYLTRARRAVSVVLGPTTPLSRVLFGFGADYLCGSVVIDPVRVLEGARAGLPFRAVKWGGGIRFFRIAREDGLSK